MQIEQVETLEVTIQARVAPELKDRLRRIAGAQRGDLSSFVRQALADAADKAEAEPVMSAQAAR